MMSGLYDVRFKYVCATWENVPFAICANGDANKPAHPRSVVIVYMKKLCILGYYLKCTQWRFRSARANVHLIVLGFNDTSTHEGHIVSSPREREKTDRRDSRGDEKDGLGRKREMKESEVTEEIKTFPSTLTCCKDSRPWPTVWQYQLGAPMTKATGHLHLTKPPRANVQADLNLHWGHMSEGTFSVVAAAV